MTDTPKPLPALSRGDLDCHWTERAGTRLAYKARPGRSPTVVFLPGFKSDMDGGKAVALDQWARGHGQAMLRLDYAGHGQSGGQFAGGTIGSWTQDALAIIDAATSGPLVLVGSSMGGWIMLLVALAKTSRVAGLVGLAPAPDFSQDLIWANLSKEERALMAAQGYLDMPSDYDDEPTRVTKALIEDGKNHLLLPSPIPLDMPVRLIHGIADPDVPWSTSTRLATQLTSQDVTITLVKSGDHRLSRPQDISLIVGTVRSLCDSARG